MTQTKYVLSRALQQGLLPIVLLNKADCADALSRIESGETESQLLDLFDNLGATEEQMDYVTLYYASARDGWVTEDPTVAMALADGTSVKDECVNMEVLLKVILDHIPLPVVHSYESKTEDGNHAVQRTKTIIFLWPRQRLDLIKYQGRTATGRIYSRLIRTGDTVTVLKRGETDVSQPTTLADVCVNRGISRTTLIPNEAFAGDIVILVGVPDSIAVGDTVTGKDNPVPMPVDTPPLTPPTLCLDFGSNNGPFAGKEGKIVASTRIRERLHKETDNNVTIAVTNSETDSEKTTVFGRGELQLGILIEQMRREGFEIIISPPRIVTKSVDGAVMEPFEEVTVDVDSEYSGTVIESLTGDRKGFMMDMQDNSTDGKTRLIFVVASRGLLGFGPEIATLTRGSAVVNHCFLEDRPYAGLMGDGLEKGKLVATENGKASTYALSSVAERGSLFIEPRDMVYAGMVISESSGPGDLDVNPVKAKALNNMRAAGKDEKVYLPPP